MQEIPYISYDPLMDKLKRPAQRVYLVRWPRRARPGEMQQRSYLSWPALQAYVERLEATGYAREEIYVWSAKIGKWGYIREDVG